MRDLEYESDHLLINLGTILAIIILYAARLFVFGILYLIHKVTKRCKKVKD